MTRISHLGLATALVASLAGVAAATPYHGPTPAEREAAMLEKYDTNRNGVIDPIERERMQRVQTRTIVQHYDINDDRKLGRAETITARRARADQLLAELDRSGNGLVSFVEARRRGLDSNLVVHFRAIDSNHDGQVSKRELVASPYVERLVPLPTTGWWGRKAPG